MRASILIVIGAAISGCGLLAPIRSGSCPLTLTVLQDPAGGAQEREVLEPPYQLALTSVDHNIPGRRVAYLEVTAEDGWGPAADRLDFTYIEPGREPTRGHTSVETLSLSGGLGYMMAAPGTHELRLTSRQCDVSVRWDVVPGQ